MAAGETIERFTAAHFDPPAANYAREDERNGHRVLDFRDSATNEIAIVTSIWPRNYGGGGITGRVHYAMSTATSPGVIVWSGAFEANANLDVDSFATAQSNSGTVPVSNGDEGIIEIPFAHGAQMDSLAVGDRYRFRLIRVGDDVSDTASGDAEFLVIELRETP
jgi:hypothetical protein